LKRTEIIILTAGLLFGAGLAVLFYYGFNRGGNRAIQSEVIEGVNLPASASVGSTAPEFELQNLNEETFSLSEMRGKIVVLNFWATWCEPCKLEMPFFEQLHKAGQSDLEIWGVNFDEPPQQVQDFVEEYNLSFPILLDPGGKVQDLYRVRGYPTTYVVDEQGVIKFHHIGLITEEQLGHYLEQMGALE
jgi:cytochrome c biogenesis protein CcmG/thiol:disulfide interchange protein DsbE